jgi:hypothetical protein
MQHMFITVASVFLTEQKHLEEAKIGASFPVIFGDGFFFRNPDSVSSCVFQVKRVG